MADMSHELEIDSAGRFMKRKPMSEDASLKFRHYVEDGEHRIEFTMKCRLAVAPVIVERINRDVFIKLAERHVPEEYAQAEEIRRLAEEPN